jgi:hypothetical protein
MGCGVYSFTGSSLPSHIKTVAVALFANETPEYALRTLMTQGVSDGLIADNTLKVVAESRADAVVRGTIKSYSRSPYSYDENREVTEYSVTVVVEVVFYDVANDRALWDDVIEAIGVYDADVELAEDGQRRAAGLLAQDIVERTTKGW